MPGPVASNEGQSPCGLLFPEMLVEIAHLHLVHWICNQSHDYNLPKGKDKSSFSCTTSEHPAWCLSSEDSGKSNPTHWQRWWILPSNLTTAPCWLEIMSRSLNVFAPLFSHPPNENGNAHVIFLKRLLWELKELMWAKWLEGSQAERTLSSQGMPVLNDYY